MKKVLIGLTIVAFASGCSFGSTAHTGEHFAMSGTPEGIRAFGDTLNGAMKTAKEKDNAPNQYFAHRDNYERNVTERNGQPGFLQKLFGGAKQQEQGS